MFIFYDLIYLVIGIFYLPVFLWRKKFHAGFMQRLGILPKDLKLKAPIWIHAVSVGEVMSIRPFLEELKKIYPDKRFVISTVTPTGNKIARNIASSQDWVTYLPLDLSFIVSSVMEKIKPSLFILTETELWPNLITCLYQKGVPVIVVNARISDGSFKGYLCIGFLLKNILNKIHLFCVQTLRDSQRLVRLGVSENRIRITGNMKFDIHDYTVLRKDAKDLRPKLGIEPQEKFLVAGSTHAGEEENILIAYKKLLKNFPDLRLLIAPRHPQRALEVQRLIQLSGFAAVRISQLSPGEASRSDKKAVFILDTVGELLSFYSIADVVFVGGSLIKKGGHNILEPAIFAKPVLFGPHMFNFRDITELFLEQHAALMVKDTQELYSKIKDLLDNPSQIEFLTQRARDLLIANQGATQKNIQIIKDLCGRISTV
jgi:3-deoxy-D-manno-octulosonic-acid transferase